MKLKFMLISLTSCSGCISSLISLDIFSQFIERTNLIYFPFMLDTNQIKDCDIALVEGCVSEEEQIEKLQDTRKHAKRVFALGTCAAFGGILSLSKKRKADPISKFIEIDGIIPGCPPPPNLLGTCLIRMIEHKNIKLPNKNLCSTCPLKKNTELNFKDPITRLNPDYNESITLKESKSCFLKHGILCLGPITREGCEHVCIEQGMPCEGCMGPVSKDYISNVINFLSLFNLSKDLRRYKGIFNRFAKPIFTW